MNRRLAHVEKLIELGKHPAARSELESLLADQPENGHAQALLSMTLLALDDPEAATQAGRTAVALSPQAPFPHRCLAAALHGLGHDGAARDSAVAAVRLDPLDAANHRMLATLLADSWSRFEAARRAAAQAVELAPQSADSHFVLGLVHHEHDRDLAERSYRQALRIEPTHSGAEHNLIVLAGKGGALDRAASFATILARNPDNRIAQQNLRGQLDRFGWRALVGVSLAMYAGSRVAGGLGVLVALVACGAGLAVLVRTSPRAVRRLLPSTVAPGLHRGKAALGMVGVGVAVLAISIALSTDGRAMSEASQLFFIGGVSLMGVGAIWLSRRTRDQAP